MEQWFSNKELFVMVQELQKQIAELCQEIGETKTLIRDYNDLRKRLGDIEVELSEVRGWDQGGKNVWGYVVGAVGIASAVFSITFHFVK